jgi:hypothetical protein
MHYHSHTDNPTVEVAHLRAFQSNLLFHSTPIE